MQIGIIDADLIGRSKHRFPNLACMKISAYLKEQGNTVELLTNYTDVIWYDEIYISKVFTDTPVPSWIEENMHKPDFMYCNTLVHIGGTGFFFDKAPNLPYEIEHHMPDYQLYDKWIENLLESGKTIDQFNAYTDYSIGFTTRGCFRKCAFCVNQKYNSVSCHSPLEEFYDPTRKKICLLDDNVFGCAEWKRIFQELQATNKPFKFRQGLDERLLTDEKCKILFSSKYDGDFIFAFDNIADYDLIETKLRLIRKYAMPSARIKFYVLVGFESTDEKDIENAFKRIALLMKYQCVPYIMRYQDKSHKPYMASKYKGMYISLARWVNQPRFFRKTSFREFCIKNLSITRSSYQAMSDFEKEFPEIAKKYFDLKFGEQENKEVEK